MKRVPSFEEVYKIQSAADEAGRDFWVKSTVFSHQWWILVALLVIPYVAWWKIVDRKRFFEITTYGLLVVLLTGLLDAIGVETDAWDYKYDLIPLLDVFIVYDVAVLPVSYMLVYQYFRDWWSFAIAHIVVSFLFAFVAEPLLVWLDIYQPISWKHIYSVPGYFFIAVFLRGVMALLTKKNLKV
ncbi:MAG TPA: CBO0543 family protein [Negativicutes bacterium]|nr:CBO0543 family protein [Negativicutes bacterium]